MSNATQNQVRALKALVKLPEIRSKYLENVDFDNLQIDQASDLIGKCRALERQLKSAPYTQDKAPPKIQGQKEMPFENSAGKPAHENQYKIRFSKNYRQPNGFLGYVSLNDQEIGAIEQAHRKYSSRVLEDCLADTENDAQKALALHNKRCHKIFSLVQQQLDYKIFLALNKKK